MIHLQVVVKVEVVATLLQLLQLKVVAKAEVVVKVVVALLRKELFEFKKSCSENCGSFFYVILRLRSG
jgi:hypothetical protein